MKLIYTAALVGLITLPSCQKTTNRGIEIEYRTDTVFTGAADTSLAMNIDTWNLYSFVNDSLVSAGPTTYFNTTEGIKFLNPVFRKGFRLQTKNELFFKNKFIYTKWKIKGDAQFSYFLPSLKYIPFSSDSSNLGGLYFDNFSTGSSYNGSYVVQDDVWYYTRIKPIMGTDTYEAITTTGDYENIGGIVVSRKTIPIYTKAGYLSFVHVQAWSTNAYAVIGECKILSQ